MKIAYCLIVIFVIKTQAQFNIVKWPQQYNYRRVLPLAANFNNEPAQNSGLDSYDRYINSLLSNENKIGDVNNANDNINKVQPTRYDDDESPIVSKPVRFVGVGTTDFEQLNNVTYALTEFSVILMRSVNQLIRGNVIVSPTSIATVLALLQQGTSGEAQDQMTRALSMPPNATAPTYQRLTYDMKKRNSRNILTVSINLYLGEGFQIEPDFKETSVQYFGSEITNVDFSRPGPAVRQINKWISIQTHNRIAELLPESAVSSSTQVLIANVVYFKGLWETKFKPESTRELLFHLSSGESITVPFMRMRHSFRYGIDEESNSAVVVMPFERYQYSLIIILPQHQSNVDNILKSLSNNKLLNYLKFDESEIQLEIPKFTIKSHTNMIPVLQKMGITEIFSPQADLTRIGTYRTYSPRISSAIHTGYLSVDEQGLSATAATSFAAIALSYEDPPALFQANRPFLAVLWDTQFAIPLFIAKIEDPSK
ncbi:seminal fluid protein CSSFP043 [Danaus plexippus plexippus]|uniref:Seminal fluid protein CSSFP043 n=1 Tax=Danaus plexippus plexippus TaxID=278856 RepID=A0A212F4C5_DANPL|nr:seminal fluid protein CSSFP043 [Danaus plexippus plexippus]